MKRPRASVTSAFRGMATLPLFPSAVMRLPETITAMSGCTGPPVASMTETCVNARGLWSMAWLPCAKNDAGETRTRHSETSSALIETLQERAGDISWQRIPGKEDGIVYGFDEPQQCRRSF